MTFYRFYPDCHYVPGPARGTLYNVTTGHSRQLTRQEADIVNMLTGHNSVESVVEHYGSDAQSLVESYVAEGLGALYRTPIFSQPYQPHTIFSVRGLYEAPPAMKVAFIQLTDACNAVCDFCCNNDSFYTLEGCNSCLRWPSGGGNGLLTDGNLARTVELLLALDVPAVIYSGGNPLMEFDALAAASGQFKKANPNIKLLVHTNGGGYDVDVAKRAKELGLSFNFTLFGTSRQEYGRTTGKPELYDQLRKAVEFCKDYQVPYDIVPLVSKTGKESFRGMRELGKTYGGKGTYSAELLPKSGNGLKKVTGPTGQGRIEQINRDLYYHNTRYSYCMNGMISIASNGAILVCPLWPEAIGNVIADGSLSKAFTSGKIDEYWKMNNSRMPVCSECENRYACVDCALLAWHSIEDPLVRRMFCDYVPETGEWQEEGVSEDEEAIDTEKVCA